MIKKIICWIWGHKVVTRSGKYYGMRLCRRCGKVYDNHSTNQEAK
jgi:hypothetical protein